MTSLRVMFSRSVSLGSSLAPSKAKIARKIHTTAQLSLSKTELVEIVAQKTGTSKVETKKILESLTDTVVNAVAKDQKVTLPGFGTFERAIRSARKGRNPQTGEEMDLPEKAVPKFTAAKAFKDTVHNSKE